MSDKSTTPLLTIRTVSKHFGQTLAVDEVDLDLASGERLCLLGHNGAGKTTLLRMIVGMALPTSGSILLLGNDLGTQPEIRRQIGYVSDKPYIYDKLTPREHLRLHAALYQLPNQQVLDTGIELLRTLGLDMALDQRAETFSFGMQKKLALTQALTHQLQLLVLDEPLNGLDPDSQSNVRDLLYQHTAAGGSVMLSTHTLDFAAEFASITTRGW
jgi:ABC-2 type transport system ATP-binding protein